MLCATYIWQNVTLPVVCFFYTLKSWDLDLPCVFTICQLTLSAGQVGPRVEVREIAFPFISVWMASILCMSDCSPRVLLLIRAVTFNLISKSKAIPLGGPEVSRRLRIPDFKTISTSKWQGCQPYALAAFTSQGHSQLKIPMTPLGIEHKKCEKCAKCPSLPPSLLPKRHTAHLPCFAYTQCKFRCYPLVIKGT